MGEVFRSQDRLTGQIVALKRVRLPQPQARPTPPHVDRDPFGMGQVTTARHAALTASTAEIPPARDNPGTEPATMRRQRKDETTAGSDASAHPLSRPPVLVVGQPKLPTAFLATVAKPPREGAIGAADMAASPAVPDSEVESLRLHLTQEFRTLAGLRHPHIVSVLDYGFDKDRQPFFTMELLATAVTLDVAARAVPVAGRVTLLLQILQALAYLHRRSVLHRDLKPSNILVIPGPGGPQVKLLDFGLAMLTQDMQRQFAEVAGTLGYMAPELLFGAPPSRSSDLFAVGVMAYELLVGTHPLGQRPTAVLMQEFLGTAPIFSEDVPELGELLSAVLRRALCRNPVDRYLDAAAFALDLATAAGLAPPAESAEIRESFLQAATFVARDRELAKLRQALEEAATGQGSAWLVGGESGVGKSRLLDELRTQALVRGARVVRGQAVSSGGAAYQVWQAALRPICLDASIDEGDAGVLLSVIPDIETLTGRSAAEPAALDPQSAQNRLLAAIEKLIASQKELLLILLEDLHWSEPASLAALSRLTRFVTQSRLPILIVGSYRNEERPSLPAEIPETQLLTLSRLPMQDVTALSISMLGEAGNRSDIVEFIARETEGNAFFIVEAVRALAEEAGSLDRVGQSRIPARVAAGGIAAVLARRLERIAKEARPFLSAAAVIGRELDVDVLRRLADIGPRWEADLHACAAAAVVETHENRWRFAHDKLREAILAELPAESRGQWHLRIGQAMEQAYSTELGAHAAALAYHFKAAGALDRAVRYGVQAGERALRSGAVQEALAHLEECQRLDAGGFLSNAERVHVLALLCQGYVSAGRPEETAEALVRMIAEVGIATPRTPGRLALDTARLLAGHAAFRLRLFSRDGTTQRDPLQRAALEEVADSYIASIGTVAYAVTQAQFLHLSLALVTLAERLADPARLASAYTALAALLSLLPLARLTDNYLDRAHALLAESPEPGACEYAVRRGAAWVYTSRGEWDRAAQCLDEELAHYQQVGDVGAELFALASRFRLDESRGDIAAFRSAQQRMEELAVRVESAQHLCWLSSTRGYLAMHAGDLASATQHFREAEKHDPRARDRIVSAYLGSNAALCALRCGDRKDARRRADATLKVLLTTPSFATSVADAVAPLVETYFLLWSERRPEPERADLLLRLRQALGVFRGMAAAFPICRPRVLLWHGHYALRMGHARLGEWFLSQALASAQRYRMPFDEGLAHLAQSELARRQGASARAQDAWQRACALLNRVEAYYYLTRRPAEMTGGASI